MKKERTKMVNQKEASELYNEGGSDVFSSTRHINNSPDNPVVSIMLH